MSTIATPPMAEKITKRRLWVILGALLLGMLLAALDQTIVSTALPTIVGDLHGGSHLAWVVTAYLLASTVSTPLWGKLGDQYGRKTFFQAAIVIFVIGSALSGFSHTMTELIAFRAAAGSRRRGLDGRRADDHRRRRVAARPGPLHGPVRRHVRRGHRDRAAHRRAVRDLPDVALGLLHQPAARDPGPVRDRRRAPGPPAPGLARHRLRGRRCSSPARRRRSSSSPAWAGSRGPGCSTPSVAHRGPRRRAGGGLPLGRARRRGAGDPAEALPGAGLQRGQLASASSWASPCSGRSPSSRCTCRSSRA